MTFEIVSARVRQHMVHVILTDAFIYFLLFRSLLCHIDGDGVRKRVRRKGKNRAPPCGKTDTSM